MLSPWIRWSTPTSRRSTSASAPSRAAQPLDGARKPAYPAARSISGRTIGVKKSSAQLTVHYTPEALVGRQVAAVVNFPPRQIGKFMSEVLTLGFPDADGAVVLVAPGQARAERREAVLSWPPLMFGAASVPLRS